MRIVAWIYVSTFSFIGVCGLHCLECDDVLKPAYCDTVTRCGTHEHCYVDAKLSTAGSIRYSLGCRDSLRCSQTHNVAKRDILNMRQNSSFEIDGLLHNRRSGGNWACSECCTGDVCNSAGCGAKGYPSQRGPICFNCPQQGTEADCNKITMCGQDQVCLLHKTTDPVIHETFYESRCESEQKCNDQLSRYNLLPDVLVGKRRRRNAVTYQDSCRLQCCKTSLCNMNCTNESTVDNKLSTDRLSVTSTQRIRTTTLPKTSPSTSSTTISSTSSVVSLARSTTQAACIDVLPECASTDSRKTICLSQVLAAKYCRKSCGYCRRSPTAQPGLIPGPSPTAQPGLLPGQPLTAQTGLIPGPSPTAQPDLLSGRSPTVQPGLIPGPSPTEATTTDTPTAAPTTVCANVSKWSSWANRDKPTKGEGDKEALTPEELKNFCGTGKIVTAECAAVDGSPYYNTGDIVDCNPTSGLLCDNMINFPLGCQDYKIRYQCEETICHDTTLLILQTSTVSTNTSELCQNRWSAWINCDSPSTGDGDRESWTKAEQHAFCPSGNITSIECMTTSDIPSYSTGEIMQCAIQGGSVCLNADLFPIRCSDYKIRYFCTCGG